LKLLAQPERRNVKMYIPAKADHRGKAVPSSNTGEQNLGIKFAHLILSWHEQCSFCRLRTLTTCPARPSIRKWYLERAAISCLHQRRSPEYGTDKNVFISKADISLTEHYVSSNQQVLQDSSNRVAYARVGDIVGGRRLG